MTNLAEFSDTEFIVNNETLKRNRGLIAALNPVSNIFVYYSQSAKPARWCADIIYEDGSVWHKFIKRTSLAGVVEEIEGYGLHNQIEQL